MPDEEACHAAPASGRGIRWALLLRAGGAFILAMLIAKIRPSDAPVVEVTLVQQVLLAPVCLLAGWLGR